MNRLPALGVLVSLCLLPLTGCMSDEPTCDDVSYYNDQVNEAGGAEFNEDSMNDYVQAQEDLAAAEADCANKGEEPQY